MNNLHLTNFDVHRDMHGILTLILNVVNYPVNIFNESVMQDLDELIREVESDASVSAVVFRSGKESGFLAGADLHAIRDLKTDAEVQQILSAGQQLFDRIEQMRIPTVAVINGVCLGGGLEFVLSCKHRIVIDDPRTRLGLPEVELGLLPGWGGTQRLPRRVGLSAALPMLLTGKKVSAREACRIGLADAICKLEDVNATVIRVLGWDHDSVQEVGILSGSSARTVRVTGWPRRLMNWLQDHTPVGRWLVLNAAHRSIAGKVSQYPALRSILKAVSTGLGHNNNRGFLVEQEEFAKLIKTETHHSLLGLFFQRERAGKMDTWVGSLSSKPRPIKKIGVIGGGVMGIGIVQTAAMQGFDVVLKEVNAELLDVGLCHIRELFDESVRKQVLSASDAATRFGAIKATTDWAAFADVDLAIEAVTERLDIKQAVFRDMERHCPAHAILASNTSALPIRAIAESTRDPRRVVGLHFFNPVHRMQLVEIVKTDLTRNEDVGSLVDFVKRFGKTPIVTADSPGFVVNRILFPYLDEAVRLHCEGVAIADIDKALKRFGMPMGPIELLDQVGIDVAAHVANSLEGFSHDPSPTADKLSEMAAQGHLGRKSGHGFYLYPKGSKGRGYSVKPVASGVRITDEDIRDRILLRLVNEAAKCLRENVVPESWMVDLAMVLGTGFAPHFGGPLRMCELMGYGETVEKMEYFTKTVGQRFAPSPWLIAQIEYRSEPHAV